jgi:hypothetical protein
MSKTLHGTVTVTLGDEEITLKPTLKAALAIERQFGGLTNAYRAIGSSSIEQIAFVIQAGAGMGTKREITESVQEKVFNAGVVNVGPQCVAYISALLNPAAKPEGEDGEDGEGNAQQA